MHSMKDGAAPAIRWLAVALFVALGSSLAAAESVTVFAAASLKEALDANARAFESAMPVTPQFLPPTSTLPGRRPG